MARYREHIPTAITDEQLRELWLSVADNDSAPAEEIKHEEASILAITYMLHNLKFGIVMPEQECSRDNPGRVWPGRLHLLKMYDKWIRCRCGDRCPRLWNFAGDYGISVIIAGDYGTSCIIADTWTECPIVDYINGNEKDYGYPDATLEQMRTEWRNH